ncbi:MAG: sugar ABC transporter substrate-binding protein [Candidatus Sericytochromatia bacterium]|nr:sugar ABC transporter substrate-binding protein [Candidatus Sericytochromatia bacterium]
MRHVFVETGRCLARRITTLLLAGALLLAGCGRSDGERTVEIKFWTMQLKPTFEDYVGGLIKAWESNHPGVRVKWVDLPANEIENKTLTATASGRAPDLVNLNPMFANKLASARALVPLNLPKATLDAYFPAALEANTVAGRLIGLPWYLSTSITLYNADLWKSAGLETGSWPTTYRELAAAARTIKQKTGHYGFLPAFGDRGKCLDLFAADHVPLLTPDGKHAAFAGPEGIQTLSFWASLFHDGVLPQEALTQPHREGIDRFQAGQIAALPAGPQFLKMVRQNAPELYQRIGLGPQVGGADGRVGMQVMNLVIPSASQHTDLAIDLALHVTSGASQLAFCRIVPILPSIQVASRDPFFQAPQEAPLEDRARALAAAQLQRATLLVPPLYRQAELAKSLDNALQRAVLKQQTPQQALEQAADEWSQILASS